MLLNGVAISKLSLASLSLPHQCLPTPDLVAAGNNLLENLQGPPKTLPTIARSCDFYVDLRNKNPKKTWGPNVFQELINDIMFGTPG